MIEEMKINNDNPDSDNLSANYEPLNDTETPASSKWTHWFSHLIELHILFPIISVLVLAAIWWTTLTLIKVERTAAERSATGLSHELAQTYESQVVRALREIDQTLKIVKYANNVWGVKNVLPNLKDRGLLPPTLVFKISIANSKGDVVASTGLFKNTNVFERDFFQSQLKTDAISVGRPQLDPITKKWSLTFSRRLDLVNGKFAGISMVTVDAAYFVSGYESSKLGEHGILGIIGEDGTFLVRRSGEIVTANDKSDFGALKMHSDNEMESETTLRINAWDGIQRYTSAYKIYGFPMTVIVGLSADEQLAAAQKKKQVYLWRAAAVSFVMLLIIAVIWRISYQLVLSRQRAVKEHIAHAARVEYLAYHDGLTKLPNRSLFSKLLVDSINYAQRYNRKLAVLFFDLDHFKNVNDTLGHEAGDQLLQEVATRVKACLRDTDTVARMGGDEFVALLPELNEEKYVVIVAQKILTAVASPFILQGQEFYVTASIGISLYPQDGMDEQTLQKNADTAMYQVKEEGRNNFQFYSEKLNAESLERLTLEAGLRHALERNEFQLDYQTKQNIVNGEITGMEALLRWHHPDLGIIAPMKFIPIAEETGLIVPIGKWVLKSACAQNVAWQNQGFPALSIAVNLTVRQFFYEHLLKDLKTILADTGMDAHLLELEVTESILIHDVEKTMRVLTELKDMGIRVAIDNFGIGYSSLSMLEKFPLDTIKIDRSFIRHITGFSTDHAMTDAVIAMGRTLSLNVIAQGVETKEQAEYLRQNACDEFQGFYLNKPLPANQISELLRKQSNMTKTDTNPST
ncbi:MAG: EAL domain-containing protein [Sulfurospirillaceae bacterium]|nr:EAL domain-containing protein [Sulfurospirillaceae bacterium]